MNQAAPHPELIYKIVTSTLFADAERDGVLTGMPIDMQDGYMHFSTAGQLGKTLELYFAGQADLTLIAVRVADVIDMLKWEPSRGGALFPHLFATLPLRKMAWALPISVADDGSCILPEAVQ